MALFEEFGYKETPGNWVEEVGRWVGQREVGGRPGRWCPSRMQKRLVGGGGLRFVEIGGVEGWF